ncbi:hypothetical protein RhiirA5_493721 [Rhizophagus irregularis]|uniref:Uncharacterized protein n=1 Tax=Rhizophagus irregularis TaxID=588596 RepID=A0A2N0QBR1_9GLOM|nr:hypothetical protein RhiirA5_493721 [Rhizophagus irregularis]
MTVCESGTASPSKLEEIIIELMLFTMPRFSILKTRTRSSVRNLGVEKVQYCESGTGFFGGGYPFSWEDPFSIPIQHYHARLEGISRHIAIILLSSTLINRNRIEVARLKAIKAINDVEDIKIFDDDFFSDELIDSNHPINARTERVPEGPRISVQHSFLKLTEEKLERYGMEGGPATVLVEFIEGLYETIPRLRLSTT